MNLIYEGSVKDIYELEKNEELLFKFSNRFSVFDWGAMPNEIPSKGESLARMSAAFFEMISSKEQWQNLDLPVGSYTELLNKLKTIGGNHHLINHDESDCSLRVKKIDVHRPEFLGSSWDYSIYQTKPTNCLVPLEVIFRWGMPSGSSLKKRINDETYCQELGLTTPVVENTLWDSPIIEFSTKLENVDRIISYSEAKEIAGLSEREFDELKNLSLLLAHQLKRVFGKSQITLWDGKFEFGFGEHRELMVVDSIGPDELRLTFDKLKLSKECLRDFYRSTSWFEASKEAKVIAKERELLDWQGICADELQETPPQLPAHLAEHLTHVYQAVTNAFYFGLNKAPCYPFAPKLNELRPLK